MPRRIRVELYAKPRCSLCVRAMELLRAVQQRVPFELVEVDISLSPTLWGRYRMDVPVVTLDGERIFHHRVDPVRFEALLVAACGTPVAQSGDQG
ncbi:MAG: glutaredoxin family protein [Myxococcaceae bacterium]|nr:glutaredoxin family protein [Myxococcaceae bacterium]MCI0673424.1 glutaredoxin family protein [Myxococcaceae bacterium]